MDMLMHGYKKTEIGVIPEDWEVVSLSNVFSYISYGYTNPMPTTNNGPWMVTANDVKNGRINYETARKTSEYAFKKLITDKSRPKVGDLLLTKDGTLGRVAIVDKSNICINQSVAVIRTNDKIEVKFLKHLLQDNFYQKVMIENAGGSTIKHIYITVVDKMPIVLPPLAEQEAIASALSDADAWIDSLEQLIAKKRLIKQGAMQTLLTPPSHAEALEAWEVKKLGEIVNFKNGAAHENVVDENGEFVIVNSKFISQEGRIRKYSNAFLCPLYKNEIVMVMSDIPNGKALAKCFIIDKDNTYTLNQRICAFEAKEGFDAKFLFYKINRNDYFLAFDSGSGQTNLRRDEVLNCPIYYPSLSEQERIATILSDMDAELEALETQLAKARQIKQGMMQELLTGRVRLV